MAWAAYPWRKGYHTGICGEKIVMSLLRHEIEDFSLTAYHNGELETVTKNDLLGGWSVLFFYPADVSFVCPTELADLADHYDQFKEVGCEIYSCSCDTEWSHQAWHDSSERVKKVSYPMLSDPSGELAQNFDVLNEETGLAERGDFIINPKGEIVAYEVTNSSVGRDAAELLRRACRRASMRRSTARRCARPTGIRESRPSRRSSIWPASSDPGPTADRIRRFRRFSTG